MIVEREPRRAARRYRPSSIVLAIVLVAAVVGAISLARQRPNPHLAAPPRPPWWAVSGHDSARTAHVLSSPVPAPPTLRWWRQIVLGARSAVVDGDGNLYLAQPDGAVLSLDDDSNTNWCVALQPITDTSCTGTRPPVPPQVLPPAVTPNATIGPDDFLYVVGAGGVLRAFDPSSAVPLWHAFVGWVPGDGVVYGPNSTLYGVVPVPGRHGYPAYAVDAVQWKGAPAPGWHSIPIPSRGLTPVSIAPDGTVLVAARAPTAGDNATLYALARDGKIRWRLPLARGQPSYATVEVNGGTWVCWVVVAGAPRSWVVVASASGRALWRWSTGHQLNVDGGVALVTHGTVPRLRGSLAYVGSSVGVYALDPSIHHSWLFFDARVVGSGAVGPPTTDGQGNVYVAGASGHVYSVAPDGHVRWRYDTDGRDAQGSLILEPGGSVGGTVVVMSHDRSGSAVVEALGAGGQPVAAGSALACAQPDCPTPTPTLSPTASPTVTPTATLTATATLTPAAISATATLTAASTTITSPTATIPTTSTPAPATITGAVTSTPSPRPALTGTPTTTPIAG